MNEDASAESRELATFLRLHVKESGSTLEQLKRVVGYSTQRLSEFLAAKALPEIGVVCKLVEATVPAAVRADQLQRARQLHRKAYEATSKVQRQVPVPRPAPEIIESNLVRQLQRLADLERERGENNELINHLRLMVETLTSKVSRLEKQRDELLAQQTQALTLDGVNRHIAVTHQQNEQAVDALHEAEEQRARAEQMAAAARLEVEELRAQLDAERRRRLQEAGDRQDQEVADPIAAVDPDLVAEKLVKIRSRLSAGADNLDRLQDGEPDPDESSDNSSASAFTPDNPGQWNAVINRLSSHAVASAHSFLQRLLELGNHPDRALALLETAAGTSSDQQLTALLMVIQEHGRWWYLEQAVQTISRLRPAVSIDGIAAELQFFECFDLRSWLAPHSYDVTTPPSAREDRPGRPATPAETRKLGMYGLRSIAESHLNDQEILQAACNWSAHELAAQLSGYLRGGHRARARHLAMVAGRERSGSCTIALLRELHHAATLATAVIAVLQGVSKRSPHSAGPVLKEMMPDHALRIATHYLLLHLRQSAAPADVDAIYRSLNVPQRQTYAQILGERQLAEASRTAN
ncbi:hypothetical protein ACWCQP_45830 [Streptomyces chartreusis]